MYFLTYQLDSSAETPLYHQLYESIKKDIQQELLKAGSKLPSKRKLAEHLKISQNTVQTAYNQLIEEGYLTSEERRGYFVNKIDWLQKVQVKSWEPTTHQTQKNPILNYDFSYHGVDHSSFPFEDWRRLLRDVVDPMDMTLTTLNPLEGDESLRHAIQNYLHQSRGVYCTSEQIILSSSVMTLYQSLTQLFDSSAIFGIENPGYDKLNLLFENTHTPYCPIAIDQEGIIPSELEKADITVLCITPSHQFPRGEIMPINRRLQLLSWASQKSDRYLIEDDYDSEFKYNTRPVPALQGMDKNEKVIYLGSFSKSLSPAIRVSYMVLPNALLDTYHRKFSYFSCPIPMIEQKALYRFLSEGFFERHLNKMRNIYRKKRETLVEEIQSQKSGIEILGANAGLHLMIEVPNGMTEQELIISAAKKGVGIYGIREYYSKEPVNKTPSLLLGFARIPQRDIPVAVQQLYEAWF